MAARAPVLLGQERAAERRADAEILEEVGADDLPPDPLGVVAGTEVHRLGAERRQIGHRGGSVGSQVGKIRIRDRDRPSPPASMDGGKAVDVGHARQRLQQHAVD